MGTALVGSAETLLKDALRLARVAGAADFAVDLQIWPRMIHAWHLFYPDLADGRRSLSSAGRFMRAHLRGAAAGWSRGWPDSGTTPDTPVARISPSQLIDQEGCGSAHTSVRHRQRGRAASLGKRQDRDAGRVGLAFEHPDVASPVQDLRNPR